MRDAGSARQSGPLICILVLGCRRSSISTHKSVKAVVAREQSRCMQRRRHTLRTTDTPTHHAQWEAIAHDRPSHPPQTPRRTDGGRQNPTHRSSADTLHVSARSMWPALSPLLSPSQRRRAATRRAEPVSAGDLGAARDAGMRDGSVGSVPKADRLGCELRQPVGGRDGWPRAGGGEGVRR